MISVKKRSVAVLFVLAMLITCGCARVELPKVQAEPALRYPRYQERQDVHVAVDPYFDSDRLINHFGTDLMKYGILPVFIVVEDRNAKALLVMRENISLSGKNSVPLKQISPAGARNPVQSDTRKTQNAAGTGALILPPVGLAVLIPAIITSESERITVTEAVSRNALLDKGIYPGEQHAGVVYFQLGEEDIRYGNLKLHVHVPAMSGEEKYDFAFDVKVPGVVRTEER